MSRRGHKRRQSKRPAVAPLHPEEQRALNRAFFAGEPADYFQMRLRRLVQFAGSTDAQERATARTYRVGNLEMRVPSVEEEPPDEKARDAFLAVECEMLLHHTAETVLRLFLAHRNAPAVPWVEVTKLRRPGDFKRAVSSGVSQPRALPRLRREVGWLWAGNHDASEGHEAEWNKIVDRVLPYLQHFADIVRSRAPLYNAAKHGLVVQPGDRKISLVGVPGMTAEGPSLAWLDQAPDQTDNYWLVKNRWLDIELDAALIFAGGQLLRGLWMLARTRYLDWPLPQPGIPLPARYEDITKAADKAEGGIRLDEVGFPPTIFSPPGSGADALLATHLPDDEDPPRPG
jgi:hypothetical protein